MHIVPLGLAHACSKAEQPVRFWDYDGVIPVRPHFATIHCITLNRHRRQEPP